MDIVADIYSALNKTRWPLDSGMFDQVLNQTIALS